MAGGDLLLQLDHLRSAWIKRGATLSFGAAVATTAAVDAGQRLHALRRLRALLRGPFVILPAQQIHARLVVQGIVLEELRLVDGPKQMLKADGASPELLDLVVHVIVVVHKPLALPRGSANNGAGVECPGLLLLATVSALPGPTA